VATRATGHWTTDEDAQLTSTVTNTRKKKYGKEHRIDWEAFAAGRTRKKYFDRWTNGFASSIDGTARRTGKWTSVEDSKLKDAVKTHGGKDWTAIAALVSGRAGNQCKHRWKGVLDPIGRANRRTGKWTAVEDRKLKDALQTHGDTNWAAISALVPARDLL
jgi:myb proto-oncogene protein